MERVIGQFPLRGPGRLGARFDEHIRTRGLTNTSSENVMGWRGALGGLRNSEERVTIGLRDLRTKTREDAKAS